MPDAGADSRATGEQREEPADRRRRTFGPAVLLGLAAGTLTAIAADHRAVEGEGRSVSAMSSLALTFDGHMPLVTGLCLVVLACWGVVLVTRRRVRRAVAALGALAGAGALAAAIAAYWQLADQLRADLTQLGVADPSVRQTPWYWVAVAGALLSVGASALAVAWTPRWPEMGSRYDAPGAADTGASGAGGPDAGPEELSSLELWKAMDDGRDPTDRNRDPHE